MQDNATYAKVPAFASLDAFLDDMEAATEKLEVLSAIGHDDWKVKGRRLQSSEISGEALSPATGHLLMLRSHMHSLISQAPGPGKALDPSRDFCIEPRRDNSASKHRPHPPCLRACQQGRAPFPVG